MEHYNQGNVYALCGPLAKSQCAINQLTSEDLEVIRRLPSFRTYVEYLKDCHKVIAILVEDAYLKQSLPGIIQDIHIYFTNFYCFLRVLLSLIQDLPKNQLGKQVRIILK